MGHGLVLVGAVVGLIRRHGLHVVLLLPRDVVEGASVRGHGAVGLAVLMHAPAEEDESDNVEDPARSISQVHIFSFGLTYHSIKANARMA